MATILEYAEDIEHHVTESGTEIVREKGISATSLQEAVENHLIPQYGDRHPVFTQLRLVSGNVSRTGNDGGQWQGFWRGTYASKSQNVSPQADVDPWDLDAQEYSTSPFPIEQPMLGGYDENGQYKQLKNSAGCLLQRTHTIYGTQHSFIFCLRNRGTRPRFNGNALINSSTTKVAGETFERHTAMLMPPTVNLRTEYDDNGQEKRSYWEIEVQIRQHPKSWITKTLNVGTMARFRDSKGKLTDTPEQIYKFVPWEKTKDEEKFQTKPKYGSLSDVVYAKHKYALLASGGKKDTKYREAYKELPWEEVTEPLPLDLDGCVYEAAMKDPIKNSYYVVELFDTELGSFSQYSFPKKREGD